MTSEWETAHKKLVADLEALCGAFVLHLGRVKETDPKVLNANTLNKDWDSFVTQGEQIWDDFYEEVIYDK